MPKRLSQADPRDVEDVVRTVPGVAFAEVVPDKERTVLRVVIWDEADSDETTGKIEATLRDVLGIDIEGGDVRLAGVANTGAASEQVRVVDLGGGIWATEPVSTPTMAPLPLGDQPFLSAAATLVSVTVSRSGDRCSARVEVDAGEGARVGEASGPATSVRMRRAVCEAAVAAAVSALHLRPLDVEHIEVTTAEPRCALVVVAAIAPMPERRAGVELLGDDAWHSFAVATLQAASGFTTTR